MNTSIMLLEQEIIDEIQNLIDGEDCPEKYKESANRLKDTGHEVSYDLKEISHDVKRRLICITIFHKLLPEEYKEKVYDKFCDKNLDAKINLPFILTEYLNVFELFYTLKCSVHGNLLNSRLKTRVTTPVIDSFFNENIDKLRNESVIIGKRLEKENESMIKELDNDCLIF